MDKKECKICGLEFEPVDKENVCIGCRKIEKE